MADEPLQDAIDSNPDLQRSLERGGVEATRKEESAGAPVYKVFPESKIPVSKSMGKLWQSRRDQAISKRRYRGEEDRWNTAIRYYNNDQVENREEGEGNTSRARRTQSRLNRQFTGTENIVFSNVSALVPATYAKNPHAEVTPTDKEDPELKMICDVGEDLVNTLFRKRAAPGVNLKRKAKRGLVMTTLTNESYLRVDYVRKQESSEQAMADLQELGQKLEKAKDTEEIKRIEGDIQALEHTVDVLEPSGPKVKFMPPHRVLRDSDSEDEDFGDSNWIMYYDYLSTEFIKARFGKRSPVQGSGTAKMIYAPTHVLSLNGANEEGMNSAESEIISYQLLKEPDSSRGSKYGYDDEEAYSKSLRSKVWYVWDRTTRRVYLFNDKDWTWPIWVWDDPYRLEGFFNLSPLVFITDPEEGVGRGEVTYYLDQQDGINEINAEMAQARQWVRRNLFYDKETTDRSEVEKYIKGDGDVAVGLDVPEGKKLDDVLPRSAPPPGVRFLELFDKTPLLQSVDRISSVNAVMRGTEFKTNTTNRAIDSYESGQQTRLDERIDSVEDQIGEVGWMILQMCLQFMPEDEVAMLIGQRKSTGWRNMTPEEIAGTMHLTIAGGSTLKPTSANKQRMALEIGQVLGQFVNAAPIPVISVMLDVFEAAFDEVILDESSWQKIQQAINPAAAAVGPEAQAGGEGVPGQGAEGGAPEEQALAQLATAIDQLPPEIREALGASIARGVPAREALARIAAASSASGEQRPQ